MSDENTSIDTDARWPDLFRSDAFVKNFFRSLDHGREQHAEQIERIQAESEHPNPAALIRIDTPVVERALKLSAERYIFPKLRSPNPVTIEDILEIGVQQMAGVGVIENEDAIKDAFRRFVAHLEMAGYERVGDPIDLGQWKGHGDYEAGLWWAGDFDDGDGFAWTLNIGQTKIHDPDYGQTGYYTETKPRSEAKAWLMSDHATQRAVDNATEHFRHPARSIAETVKLLATHSYQSERTEFDARERAFDDAHKEEREGWSFDAEEMGQHQPPIPVFSETMPKHPSADVLCTGWGRAVFRMCCDAFFEGGSRKPKEMSRRLYNAVVLLTEADVQSHDAIRLALCCSAIEALLCNVTSGIADQLSSYIATLLQPDSNLRENLIARVKKLYNTRSRALHGENLEISGEDQYARLLAAAVIRAIAEWEEYQHRTGVEAERTDFLKELKSATISGGLFVGVSDELAIYVE